MNIQKIKLVRSINKDWLWISIVVLLSALISLLHYLTPTMNWQYHLIYMQSYFIPILIAAFQFGIKGGIGSALLVSVLYLPHVMLQWGGLVEANLMRFLQIVLFYVIGYLTGLKAEKEKIEKERFRRAARQLEINLAKLREQAEKLSDMEEQLRHADRLAVIGEMTASLAHEVRNPLGAIRGAVEILRDQMSSQNKTSEFFTILIDETKRLNSVVENYLQYARTQKPQKTVFEVKDILQQASLLLARQFRKQQVELITRWPDSPCPMNSDPNQLWQVLINLLLNALQAINGPGSVTMELTSSQTNNVSASGVMLPNLCLSVSDTGQGMTKKEIRQMFKPFYTTKEEGSGLGLAIVKRIADENDWKVDAQSELNKGTAFHLIIPAGRKS
jgi:signal transduction histidine kinase